MEASSHNISQTLSAIASQVNPVIEKILTQGISPRFKEIILYQIKTGGKRLRPGLAILSCQALKGKTENVLYPAAGLEILHNYTLIIDDIIDKGLLRRGQPTVWKKYGSSIAQCIACIYAAAIPESARNCPKPLAVNQALAEALKQVSQGQFLDIFFEKNTRLEEPYIAQNRPSNISQQDYQQMIGLKTAALFRAACHIGGLCAKADEQQIKFLQDFGFNLGLAFQIKDDLLDIFGDEKTFGKKIGKDIEEKKGGNLTVLLALKELNQKQGGELEQILKQPSINQAGLNQAIQLISKTKAQQKALASAQKFTDQAKASLKGLPQNKYTQTLALLAAFTLSRQQ